MPILVPRAKLLLSLWLAGTTTIAWGASQNARAPAPMPPQPSVPASAPATDPVERQISLEEAIQIAQRNHADVTVASENLRAARQRVTEAKTGTLPSITGGVSYSGRGVTDLGGIFGSGPNSTRRDEGPLPAIEARQTLFDQGQTRLQVRQARSSVTSAEGGLRDVRRRLTFNVTSDYIQLLRSRQQLLLREEQVRQAQQQLDLIDARIQVGDAAQSDRYPALRELRLAELRRIEAQNGVNVSSSALRNSMGLPVGPPVNVADLPQPTFQAPPLDESVSQALQQRPDLTQDEASVASSSVALSLARIRRRPLFNASVAADVTPRQDLSRGDWSFLTSVTMPLWDAGLTKARQREAAAGLERDQARLEQTRKDISAEVQQAILNLASAHERVQASKATVEAAQVAFDVANERYRQGLVRIVDLTDAQVGLFTARNEAINALFDYHLAHAQFELATAARTENPSR